MLKDLDVLVLAAGKSTRIAALSQGLPKPLIQIQGRSILEHNLAWLANQGIQSLWINLHYKADEIRRVIGSGERFGLQINYSSEPEILGTAGAYKNLESQFHRTTLIVYGDNLISFDLSRFLEAHRRFGTLATMALFDQNVHKHTGIAGGRVVIDHEGYVQRFEEATGETSGSFSGLVNAGVYLLEAGVLSLIPPNEFWDFGKNVFPKMLETPDTLSAYVIEKEGYCLGLDQPESFERGLKLIEKEGIKLQ